MARETCPYCRGSGHPSAYACLGRCYLCGESVEAPRHLGAEDIAGARQLIRRYRRRIVHEVCGAVARDLDPAFALERPGWANPPPGPSPA